MKPFILSMFFAIILGITFEAFAADTTISLARGDSADQLISFLEQGCVEKPAYKAYGDASEGTYYTVVRCQLEDGILEARVVDAVVTFAWVYK